jgi:hypothetical protein
MRISLFVCVLAGCGGAKPEAKSEVVPPPAPEPAAPLATYACNGLKVAAPAGGSFSHDEDGNVVVKWPGQKASLRLPSDKPAETPPIAYDAESGGSAPPSDAPPPPKDSKKERHILEKLLEKKLRAQGCEPTRDERPTVTWYSCHLPSKNGARAHVLTGVGEGDEEICLSFCVSADSDQKAIETCAALAPAP